VRQRRWLIIVTTITIVRSANLTAPNGTADPVREHVAAAAHAARDLLAADLSRAGTGIADEELAEFGENRIGEKSGPPDDEEQRQEDEPGDKTSNRERNGFQRHGDTLLSAAHFLYQSWQPENNSAGRQNERTVSQFCEFVLAPSLD
jgi:hypothetical protein